MGSSAHEGDEMDHRWVVNGLPHDNPRVDRRKLVHQ